MRAISKAAEPASLIAHRQTQHCDYENYPEKNELRHALVGEQKGLCCYCMGRIHNGPGFLPLACRFASAARSDTANKSVPLK